MTSVVSRCDQPGHKSGRPKIAEVAITEHGMLYQAKIPFFRSDQLTLRPWARQQYLGTALDGVSLAKAMGDDAFLDNWLDHLDSWSAGHTSTNQPWLLNQRPYILLEVLDLPDRLGQLDLWARCPKHPDGVRHDLDELLTAARHARA